MSLHSSINGEEGCPAERAGRLLPRQVASELLMAGERITPRRLHELGVVNRVVPPGSALAEALEIADQLNGRAPNVLASVKELLNDAGGSHLTGHLAAERDHFVRNLHHPNAGIGIAAFLGKLKPDYE